MSIDPRGYRGFDTPSTSGDDVNSLAFMISQMINKVCTSTLVQVQKVSNAGGIVAAGTVAVQPLVNMIDGFGNAIPHGRIYNLPYFRLQGGSNAIILDPQVNDIGLAIFAHSDISNVIVNKTFSVPGSRRKFDFADGLYIGGFLNGVPTQYVDFAAGGILITSPTAVTITAPTVTINGNVVQTGSITSTGDITAGLGGADQIGLRTHKHGTGTPTPNGTVAPTAGT